MILNESQKISESVDVSSIKKGDWIVATIYGNLVPAKMESSKISGPTFRAWSHGEHLAEYSRSTIKYHAKSEDDAIEWIKKNK